MRQVESLQCGHDLRGVKTSIPVVHNVQLIDSCRSVHHIFPHSPIVDAAGQCAGNGLSKVCRRHLAARVANNAELLSGVQILIIQYIPQNRFSKAIQAFASDH